MGDNRVLYSDGKVKIECDPREINGHIVYIGDRGHFFPRGVLSDLYQRESADSLRESLCAMDEMVLSSLEIAGVSLEKFGWDLAIAKATDLEYRANY